MGYATTYGCPEGSEAQYVCHDCPGERHEEYGRTRSGGFVKRGYLATLLAGLNDPQVWKDGIAQGKIIILPEVSGSFDPGTPKENKGFGSRKFTYGGRTMVWDWFDPNYKENYAFYNELSQRTDLIPFFTTSSLLNLFDQEAVLVGSNPITEELEDLVTWTGKATVISKNLPSQHDLAPIAEIFTCDFF